MNILYFTGNGFDLNLGMPTKYSDFYTHYKQIGSINKEVQRVKDNIDNDYKNWADLELAIGKHTQTINSPDDFEVIFDDIIDNLGDYYNRWKKISNLMLLVKKKYIIIYVIRKIVFHRQIRTK